MKHTLTLLSALCALLAALVAHAATIPGITVGQKITTGNTLNTWSIGDTAEMAGTPKQVADATARTNIPAARRTEGMECWEISTGKNWRLVGGTNDSNWVEVTYGGGSAPANTVTNPYSGAMTFNNGVTVAGGNLVLGPASSGVFSNGATLYGNVGINGVFRDTWPSTDVLNTNVYWKAQSATFANAPAVALRASSTAETNDIVEFVQYNSTDNQVPYALWRDGYNRLWVFNATNSGTIVNQYYTPVDPSYCLAMDDNGQEGKGLHLKPAGYQGLWTGDDPTSNFNYHEVYFVRAGNTNGTSDIEGITDADFQMPAGMPSFQLKVPLVFTHDGTFKGGVTNINEPQGWNIRAQRLTPFIHMSGPSYSDNSGTNAMRSGFILQEVFEADQAWNAGGLSRHRFTRGIPGAKTAVGANRLIWQDQKSAWTAGGWYTKLDLQTHTGPTGRGTLKVVCDNSAENSGGDEVTPLIVHGDNNEVQVTKLVIATNAAPLQMVDRGTGATVSLCVSNGAIVIY